MADTFTPNFNFVLPEIGGSPDTWGNKLNENFSELDNLVVPSGLIAMWSGSVANIPAGWALCDGSSGTPDLRGRFIIGAGDGYSVGDTGGAESVTLAANQMPSHSHSGSTGSAGGHNHGGSTGNAGGHSHSGSVGDNTHTHNVRFRTTAGSDGTGYFGTTDGSLTQRGSPNASAAEALDSNTHNHSLSINSVSSHSHSINTSGAHTHNVTIGSAGGNESHENRPPYYALAYIMKV